ncbi:hypothetical protein PAPYR_9032 [Paratrimastix pyriformis]|uniref:EGF-like domain-containing protein n=1 Tax=Paratrimastix pyriformis TaxID=342808 RepID=A0ABQ8U9A9_9EUKA|nr:hypothetical protein PAPYR_9032 [Paratrimastix pyriformis]
MPCKLDGDCLHAGSCGPNGTCLCSPGWSGPACAHPEGDCTTSTDCQRGGACVGAAPARTCQCPVGWAGTLCQTQTLFCPTPALGPAKTVEAGCLPGAPIGSLCTVGCAWGYIPTGNGTAVCTNRTALGDAAYVGTGFECSPATCPALAPPAPLEVALGCTSGTPLGSANCTVQCPWGYATTGDGTYTCRPSGPGAATFQGGSMSCAALSCVALVPDPSQFVISGCVENATLGNVCQMACRPGYIPHGSGLFVCQGTGPQMVAYVGDLLCEAVTCPALEPVPPALVVSGCGADAPLGSPCRLGCPNGYAATGSADYPCAGTGVGTANYTGGSLACTAVTCPALSPSDPTTTIVVAGCEAGAPLGASCVLGCKAGLIASGEPAFTCTGTGPGAAAYVGGSLACIALEATCVVVTGSSVCERSHSGMHTQPRAPVRVAVSLSNPGPPGTCAAPELDPSLVVVSGCLPGGALGSSCQLGCAPGYEGTGNPVGICTKTDAAQEPSYAGATLQCHAVSCPPYPSLPSGAVVLSGCDSAPLGSTCSLGCELGYMPSGPSEWRCVGTAVGVANYTGGDLQCTAASSLVLSSPGYHLICLISRSLIPWLSSHLPHLSFSHPLVIISSASSLVLSSPGYHLICLISRSLIPWLSSQLPHLSFSHPLVIISSASSLVLSSPGYHLSCLISRSLIRCCLISRSLIPWLSSHLPHLSFSHPLVIISSASSLVLSSPGYHLICLISRSLIPWLSSQLPHLSFSHPLLPHLSFSHPLVIISAASSRSLIPCCLISRSLIPWLSSQLPHLSFSHPLVIISSASSLVLSSPGYHLICLISRSLIPWLSSHLPHLSFSHPLVLISAASSIVLSSPGNHLICLISRSLIPWLSSHLPHLSFSHPLVIISSASSLVLSSPGYHLSCLISRSLIPCCLISRSLIPWFSSQLPHLSFSHPLVIISSASSLVLSSPGSHLIYRSLIPWFSSQLPHLSFSHPLVIISSASSLVLSSPGSHLSCLISRSLIPWFSSHLPHLSFSHPLVIISAASCLVLSSPGSHLI